MPFLVACIPMKELSFEVRHEDDGEFSASCELSDGVIATQGDTWKELEAMVHDAVQGYFGERDDKPACVRLHLEHDEVLPVSA